MTLNITNPVPLQVDGKDLPITETFTYMGSTVRNDGGAGNDIMNRLNKARNVFRTLNIICKSSQYSKPTKYTELDTRRKALKTRAHMEKYGRMRANVNE